MTFFATDPRHVARWAAIALVASIGLCGALAPAQGADIGANWSQLSNQEQVALQPLEGLWSTIPVDRKQKWREIATRFPGMTADERNRIRERMVDWAKLSPAERGAARFSFEQTKTLPLTQRQAGWDAYKALPEDQRKALASQANQRTAVPAGSAKTPLATANPVQTSTAPALRAPVPSATASQPKSNIVATSQLQGRPVSPAIVQATAGASTRPINQKAAPPVHHQPGQPKIAATPEFIDRSTLLPQRLAPASAEPSPKVSNQ